MKPASDHNLINRRSPGRFAFFLVVFSQQVFPPLVIGQKWFSRGRQICRSDHGLWIVLRNKSLRACRTIRNPRGQFFTHVHYCSVDTELIDGYNSAKNHFNNLWITTEGSKAHVPKNTGCRLSVKLSNMCSATSSHSPFGLYVCDPYHFFSDPGPRNDQRPCKNIFVYPATVLEVAMHNSLYSFVHHFLDLGETCNVVNPGENFPLEIHWLPGDSIPFSILREVPVNHSCGFGRGYRDDERLLRDLSGCG